MPLTRSWIGSLVGQALIAATAVNIHSAAADEPAPPPSVHAPAFVAERRPPHIERRLASDRIVEVYRVVRFVELPGVLMPMTETEVRDLVARVSVDPAKLADVEAAIAIYLRDAEQTFKAAMKPVLERMDEFSTRGAIIGSVENATFYRDLLRDAGQVTDRIRAIDNTWFSTLSDSLASDEDRRELSRLRSIRARNERADGVARVRGADIDVEALLEWLRLGSSEPIDMAPSCPILADYAARAATLIPARTDAAIDLFGRGSVLTATRLAGGPDTTSAELSLRARLAEADEAVVRLNLQVAEQLHATLPPHVAGELQRIVFEESAPRTYPDVTAVASIVRTFADAAKLDPTERAGLLALVDAAEVRRSGLCHQMQEEEIRFARLAGAAWNDRSTDLAGLYRTLERLHRLRALESLSMVDAALAIKRDERQARTELERLERARNRLLVSTLGLAASIGVPLDDLPSLPTARGLDERP